jgi:hypothetical protein
MEQLQIDPQHVINSLVRQISEQAQKIAMLEAILDQQQSQGGEQP